MRIKKKKKIMPAGSIYVLICSEITTKKIKDFLR